MGLIISTKTAEDKISNADIVTKSRERKQHNINTIHYMNKYIRRKRSK